MEGLPLEMEGLLRWCFGPCMGSQRVVRTSLGHFLYSLYFVCEYGLYGSSRCPFVNVTPWNGCDGRATRGGESCDANLVLAVLRLHVCGESLRIP